MKDEIEMYYDARVRMTKALRRISNKIMMVPDMKLNIKYLGAKATILKEMRYMDKILGKVSFRCK